MDTRLLVRDIQEAKRDLHQLQSEARIIQVKITLQQEKLSLLEYWLKSQDDKPTPKPLAIRVAGLVLLPGTPEWDTYQEKVSKAKLKDVAMAALSYLRCMQ